MTKCEKKEKEGKINKIHMIGREVEDPAPPVNGLEQVRYHRYVVLSSNKLLL